jgi:hypothetical protein
MRPIANLIEQEAARMPPNIANAKPKILGRTAKLPQGKGLAESTSKARTEKSPFVAGTEKTA